MAHQTKRNMAIVFAFLILFGAIHVASSVLAWATKEEQLKDVRKDNCERLGYMWSNDQVRCMRII